MRYVTLLVLTAFSIGCATIIKPEEDRFEIQTQPAGAVVTYGKNTCHTPCTLELPRKQNFSFKITKPGFKTQTVEVTGSSWDAWVLGNIGFFWAFPIGMAYDFYTGAAYDFEPEFLDLKLKK